MIEVLKDKNADSRAADEDYKITKKALKTATENHIDDVNKGMKFFADMIIKAGEDHDNTKLSHFDDFSELITNGIKDEKFKASAWYKMHVTKERHHLQAHIPNDITLIDLIEYITDCTMAGLTRSGKIYDITLPNEVLKLAFENTAELLKKNVKVNKSNDLLDTTI